MTWTIGPIGGILTRDIQISGLQLAVLHGFEHPRPFPLALLLTPPNMPDTPLLERRSPLRMSYALLILVAFFFLLPSAFRAARLSLGEKENDVKDWLPSDFPETAELEWFADHFAGEAFVLATWEGCTSQDQRLKLLSTKLRHESEAYRPSESLSPELAASYQRARQTGKDLQLILAGADLNDWGGENEKWLCSADGRWYYIKPDGGFYRWNQGMNAPAAVMRKIRRARGSYELGGTFLTAFGKAVDGSADSLLANPFYNDPSLLTAPLFETVQTGDDIIDTLAREGGPLWPIDMTDSEKRPIVARRLAMQRLTGMLFAPAVASGFDWTPASFTQTLHEDRRSGLPGNFDTVVTDQVHEILRKNYGGSVDQLAKASDDEQARAWYEVWDTVGVEPPPRLTCVLVTLTDLAKGNLNYAIGRGIMGQPRGRLLQLADESGVYAARPPAMAPPPFNREPAITTATMPALRMGGPMVDNMAIDEEGTVTLVRLVGYSILLGVVLSYFCFRSVLITMMIFIVGGSSAMLAMAMVWWTGGKVDAILMSMPSLVYVLGLSGAIHVINYYRDEVRARGEPGAAGRALRHAAMPCALASLTTAIGLASLYTSNLKPISGFGLYSAIGVMSTLGILFSYLPASLATFKPKVDGAPGRSDAGRSDAGRSDAGRSDAGRSDASRPGDGAGSPENPSAPRVESRLSDWWASVGKTIAHHHAAFTIGCLVFLVACGIGMKQIKTSVQLLELFDPSARIIRDYAWLEDNFGKLVPMELIVRMPPEIQAEYSLANDESSSSPTTLTTLERVEVVSRIRKVVHRTLGQPGQGVVGQAASADTFLPPLPSPSNRYNARRAKFNRELVSAGDQLRDNDYLKIEKAGKYKDSELWRISLRVAALSDVDYGAFIATLREAVSPVLNAYETRDEVIRALSPDGQRIDRAKVLIVGAGKPSSLDVMPLVSEDGSTLLGRNTYLATLGELLANERIENPRWLNLSAEKTKTLVASPQWQKVVRRFDAVIWVGGQGFAEEHFAAAEHLIDAREADARVTQPMMMPDRIPTVVGGGPIQAIYTGVIPVVYKAQRTLLTSLADSIGLAFVLIAIVMVLLLNPGNGPAHWFRPQNFAYGLAAGMVAMIPNIFPVVVVFGVMCHMGIEIDIGTMMTASVAMGVAVDDTIHYLSWFRDNLDGGKTRVESVIETYRRVGPAMTQTTIVGGLGLFVFALSTFTPTQRFGTLMLVMLVAALVGDLVLLPALLAGPLGRVFKPRQSATKRTPATEVSQPAITSSPIIPSAPITPEVITSNGLPKSDDLPYLKVHFPVERKDSGHRIKRK